MGRRKDPYRKGLKERAKKLRNRLSIDTYPEYTWLKDYIKKQAVAVEEGIEVFDYDLLVQELIRYSKTIFDKYGISIPRDLYDMCKEWADKIIDNVKEIYNKPNSVIIYYDDPEGGYTKRIELSKRVLKYGGIEMDEEIKIANELVRLAEELIGEEFDEMDKKIEDFIRSHPPDKYIHWDTNLLDWKMGKDWAEHLKKDPHESWKLEVFPDLKITVEGFQIWTYYDTPEKVKEAFEKVYKH